MHLSSLSLLLSIALVDAAFVITPNKHQKIEVSLSTIFSPLGVMFGSHPY
jgi:hypothetical protein